MEIQRLEDLASAATLGHWPPHLLAQDEDRIYVLGQALKEATEKESGSLKAWQIRTRHWKRKIVFLRAILNTTRRHSKKFSKS